MGMSLKRSKDLIGGGNTSFFNVLSYDFILTSVIIGSLMLCASVSAFQAYRKAEMTAAMGRASNFKNAVVLYYTMHGKMPDTASEMEHAGVYELLGAPKYHGRSEFGAIEVEQGAIHMPLRKNSQEVVTWRPAVLRADPMGSLVWVIGEHFNAKRWQAFGVDRTTVPEGQIDALYYTD